MKTSTRIAVIGAGLGGITVASLLQRAGFLVKIYEQAPAFSRIGAGIHLSSNVMMVMRRMSIEQRLVDVGLHPEAFVSRKSDTGEVLFRLAFDTASEAAFGGPYINVHRGDLLEIMAGTLSAGTIEHGRRLASLSRSGHATRLTFDDGGHIDADIVIGADGVNSRVRDYLFGASPPRYTGSVAHRAIFPTTMLGDFAISHPVTKWWGRDRHILIYYMTQTREETYLVTAAPQAQWHGDGSFVPCPVEELAAAFADFHPEVRRVIATAPSVTKWPVFDREPVPTWHRDGVVLLGDAAHAMRPYMASGAAMAIEDAAVLARCIHETDGDAAEAFAWYETNRMPRVTKVTTISQANTWLREPVDPSWLFCYDAWFGAAGYACVSPHIRHLKLRSARVMDAFICTTCGTQFDPSEAPPPRCDICDEYRQFVLPSGQNWTTLKRLQRTHKLTLRDEAGLLGLGTAPDFGIGQRALLVRAPEGNILWDCISLVTDWTVEMLKGLGGVKAIAISHPHYYTTMVDWSRALGGVPVYLHAKDKEWIMRHDSCLELWEGDTKEIAPGMTLIKCGGHYEGGTIMHWAQGAGGKGAILSGDLLQVVADCKHLGFMRSYPNFLPLGAAAVRRIAAHCEPWRYDVIYGAFWDRVIATDGKGAMKRSVDRHIEWLDRDPT